MILFHYTTVSGKSPVREFIENLSVDSRCEILTLLRRLESGEHLTLPHVRSLSSIAHGLYELRTRDEQSQVRVFYYTKLKDSIVLLHAFRKKSQAIPDKDRLLILKRIRELNTK